MDKKKPVYVVCDECGHGWVIDKWLSIDAQEDTEIVQMIEDGLFFSEICPRCGREYQFVNPTIYYDSQKRIMICFVEGLLDSTEAECFIEQIINDVGAKANGVSVRLTTTCNEFREKIILANNDLDDRIIEIIKINACDFMRDSGCTQVFKEVRCGASKQNGITIDFVGENPRYLGLERERYENVKRRIAPLFKNKDIPLRVDREWAMHFCEENNIG